MRSAIVLVRNGEPYEIKDLETGDEVLFDVKSGEIYSITDKEGTIKLKVNKDLEGKPGRMIVASR